MDTEVKVILSGMALGLGMIIYYWSSDDQKQNSIYQGIANLGNTCFLNAVIQAFSTSQRLRDIVSQVKFTEKQITENFQNRIVQELAKCINFIVKNKGNLVPDEFIKSLEVKFPNFGDQQDSQEIYLIIQEAIQDSICVINSNFYLDSYINPFMGMQSILIQCLKCQKTKCKLESFTDLSIQVDTNLYSSLAEYTKSQSITDFKCKQCLKSSGISLMKPANQCDSRIQKVINKIQYSSEATYTIKIARFPQTLCFHIKRIVFNTFGYLMKDTGYISFPSVLCINQLLQEHISTFIGDEDIYYKLIAVIEHRGSIQGGHYVTYKQVEGQWYFCSDSYTTMVDWEAVRQTEAYMLFYEVL